MVLLLNTHFGDTHMSNKLYTIAGMSTLNGVAKVRFANGKAEGRAKVLARNGHTDINLLPLPRPMTKDEAKDFVKQTFAA
jgi:hypothetical protein